MRVRAAAKFWAMVKEGLIRGSDSVPKVNARFEATGRKKKFLVQSYLTRFRPLAGRFWPVKPVKRQSSGGLTRM